MAGCLGATRFGAVFRILVAAMQQRRSFLMDFDVACPPVSLLSRSGMRDRIGEPVAGRLPLSRIAIVHSNSTDCAAVQIAGAGKVGWVAHFAKLECSSTHCFNGIFCRFAIRARRAFSADGPALANAECFSRVPEPTLIAHDPHGQWRATSTMKQQKAPPSQTKPR